MMDLNGASWRLRGDPDPIDIHVGGRARLRRVLLGMSQETVAAHLGVSFQQLQKYESGTNRISASRLYDLAHGLQVEVAYFFEGVEKAVQVERENKSSEQEILDSRITIDLVREFHSIRSLQQRRSLLELIRTMAATSLISDSLLPKET